MEDPERPGQPCPLADLIVGAAASGGLPLFLEALAEGADGLGLGNCHGAAMALLTDLKVARRSDGVRLVNGTVNGDGGPISHSWIEHAGWAAEVGYGRLLLVPAAFYREQKGADVRVSLSAEAFAAGGHAEMVM